MGAGVEFFAEIDVRIGGGIWLEPSSGGIEI